jgi:hypothetical protein
MTQLWNAEERIGVLFAMHPQNRIAGYTAYPGENNPNNICRSYNDAIAWYRGHPELRDEIKTGVEAQIAHSEGVKSFAAGCNRSFLDEGYGLRPE